MFLRSAARGTVCSVSLAFHNCLKMLEILNKKTNRNLSFLLFLVPASKSKQTNKQTNWNRFWKWYTPKLRSSCLPMRTVQPHLISFNQNHQFTFCIVPSMFAENKIVWPLVSPPFFLIVKQKQRKLRAHGQKQPPLTFAQSTWFNNDVHAHFCFFLSRFIFPPPPPLPPQLLRSIKVFLKLWLISYVDVVWLIWSFFSV